MSPQVHHERRPVRILILGTGQMGCGIARLVLEKAGLELVGAYARRAERAGLDLGDALGLENKLYIRIRNDLQATIKDARPDLAIQATCSRANDAAAEISTLVANGVHVISIAEEMAYPACASPTLADELDRLALKHGVSILGTGINPGFVLDLLVIALTGVCARIESITATRVNDLSPYGPSVLKSQGVGLAPEEFRAGLRSGSVVGHIGFQQSAHLIARAVGWSIDRVIETREPIVSKVPRQTSFVTVAPGQVAGCLHQAVAYRGNAALITLNHPQQIHPQLEDTATGDTIEIFGTPHIRLTGSPEIPGGIGTVALAVNMILHVLNAKPGLHTVADLPVPAALLGDARDLIRGRFTEVSHG
jgi:4-hydroxy-tetrahydrodipicolinate reductase